VRDGGNFPFELSIACQAIKKRKNSRHLGWSKERPISKTPSIPVALEHFEFTARRIDVRQAVGEQTQDSLAVGVGGAQ